LEDFFAIAPPSVDILSVMKIVVEKHPDGFVAYPLGLKGVVIGQGDSYDQALADVRSAIRFHVESFGKESLEDNAILDAYLVEEQVT
jgi:predicted RNase H-like HicB family nuclease